MNVSDIKNSVIITFDISVENLHLRNLTWWLLAYHALFPLNPMYFPSNMRYFPMISP